jgi:deazaflavin-dependent oxidoreductase (nitroreductase family)
MPEEPRAARLHPLAVSMSRPQNALVRLFRHYFERAPGWVLLTTTGRKSGKPREVLLPCERTQEALLLISTYGWRAHWLRNIQHDPHVRFTAGGWILPGQAEIIEETARKRALVAADPFFPGAPFLWVHALLRTLFRPFLVFLLKRWVEPRPVVLIRPELHH